MHTLDQLRSGALAGATRLDLSAGLEEFPPEVFALADTLEVLNLSGNALHSLPDGLPRLHRLRVLFCSDNRFERLPEVLGRCASLEMVGFKANRIAEVPAAALPPRLRWLILTDNRIESLPGSLGDCARLQKLMLAGNRLRALPAALARCQRLELLRIAANRLDALPAEVLALPRLAWLAFAGNPFCAPDEEHALTSQDLPLVDWRALRMAQTLGQGASGVIHRVGQDGGPDAALKLFKGAITSDGTPRSEMAAGLAAGPHPHLVGAQARLANHPEGADGLLMPLIDPAFRNLAGPPSLDSCTRDIYADGARFDWPEARAIARGVADAAAHLHGRGLMHGDLYAHNILWRTGGDCRLGDFGAASFHASLPAPQAAALQRIEVRAFGCLLEELAARSDAPASAVALAERCLQPGIAARPSFAELQRALAG